MKHIYKPRVWQCACSALLAAVPAMASTKVPGTLSDPVTELSYTVPQAYFNDVAEMDAKADATGFVFTKGSVTKKTPPAVITGWFVSGTLPTFKGGCVDIPSTYTGTVDGEEYTADVIGISENAFEGKTGIDQIRIPSTVITIGNHAFKGCTELRHIYFLPTEKDHESVTFAMTLGYNYNDSNPENRQGLFHDTKIEYVDLGRYFEYEPAEMETAPFNGVGTLKFAAVTEGLAWIPKYVFLGANALEAVYVNPGVTRIEQAAFYKCKALSFVSLPDGLKEIYSTAFASCGALKKMSLPASLNELDAYAFSDCPNLEYVNFNGNKNLTTISEGVFQNDVRLKAFVYPENITSVGDMAFYENIALKDEDAGGLVLPPKVVTIGNSSYYGCTGIRRLVVPRTVETIGVGAFSQCSNIQEIDFFDKDNLAASPNMRERAKESDVYDETALVQIEDAAFYNTPLVETLTIPNSVVSIGSDVFYGCANMKEIHLGTDASAQLFSIGNTVFAGGSNIANVHSTVTSPPNGQDDTFDNETYKKAYLHVPADIQDLYEKPTPRPWILFMKSPQTGVGTLEKEKDLNYTLDGDILTVDEMAKIYDLSGRFLGKGTVRLPAHGVYLINKEEKTAKLVY